MASITASFPFKHGDRWVRVGETLEVDESFARQKIRDGHAQIAAISGNPAPTFVTPPPEPEVTPPPGGAVVPTESETKPDNPQPVDQGTPDVTASNGGGKGKRG